MDFPDFAPPIVVTQTYKRKRGRGPRYQHHSLVPSPLRNGISISQYGSDEEEVVSKGNSKRSSGTPPPRQSSHSTPPSTPPRKRKVGSQASSPSKSSPSPSKVSIDRELGKIFSPKSQSSRETEHSGEGEESLEELPSSETTRNALLLSPRKPSFADRMARRKTKKTESSDAEQDDDTEKGYAESESQLSEILSSQSGSQEEDSVLDMPVIHLHPPSERVYRRVRSMPEGSSTPPLNAMAEEEAQKTCLSELSRRWEELDDLDDVDEESTVNNITDLRARGQDRQFREDFQYLVLDLKPSQSLSDRRSTCVEIAKKVITWNKEAEDVLAEEKAGQTESSQAQHRLKSLTPFLSQVKTADLTSQLWTQLRLAGAGSGSDKVLDLALALICFKIVKCDAALSLSFSRQDDFCPCLARMMASNYQSNAGRKDLQRHLSTLNQLTKSSSLCPHEREVRVSTIALQIVSTLADTHNQSGIGSAINIAQIDDETNCSIQSLMWNRIADEAKTSSQTSSPDHYTISLIAQTIVSCTNQVDTLQRLDTSTMDLATLLRHYARPSLVAEQPSQNTESQLDTLCSLLRMTVALMSVDGCSWDNDIIQAEGFLDCIIHLTIKSASSLLQIEQEQDRSTIMDPFTLCLALLTDFLVKDALRTRQTLLTTETGYQIGILAQLLQQQRQISEEDANSGYLAGSLAVVLALLVVGSEKANGSSEEEVAAIEQIKEGFQCLNIYDSILIIRNSLVEFAVMVQVASRTQQGLSTNTGKVKEEEEFFVALSESLTLLLEYHSPSTKSHD